MATESCVGCRRGGTYWLQHMAMRRGAPPAPTPPVHPAPPTIRKPRSPLHREGLLDVNAIVSHMPRPLPTPCRHSQLALPTPCPTLCPAYPVPHAGAAAHATWLAGLPHSPTPWLLPMPLSKVVLAHHTPDLSCTTPWGFSLCHVGAAIGHSLHDAPHHALPHTLHHTPGLLPVPRSCSWWTFPSLWLLPVPLPVVEHYATPCALHNTLGPLPVPGSQ